jgi:hypothetical protein
VRLAIASLLAGLWVVSVRAPSVAQPARSPGWEVRVSERIELASGAAGQLEIAIAVDRGLTVSKDGPVIIDVAAPAPVVIKKRRLGRGDAADPGADAPRFAIPVRLQPRGEHVIGLRVRFWVCGDRTCRPVDVKRSTTVVSS